MEDTLRSAIARLPEKDECTIYRTQAPRDATRYVRQWCQDHPGQAVRFIACGGEIIYENDFTVEIAEQVLDLAVPE